MMTVTTSVVDDILPVIGLGDVVIPGLYVRLMYTVDKVLQPQEVPTLLLQRLRLPLDYYFALWWHLS
jgi:hypothetical protein